MNQYTNESMHNTFFLLSMHACTNTHLYNHRVNHTIKKREKWYVPFCFLTWIRTSAGQSVLRIKRLLIAHLAAFWLLLFLAIATATTLLAGVETLKLSSSGGRGLHIFKEMDGWATISNKQSKFYLIATKTKYLFDYLIWFVALDHHLLLSHRNFY